MDSIQLEIVVGILKFVIPLILGWALAVIKRTREEEKAIKNGLCALLKYEIMRITIRTELFKELRYSDNEALSSLYNALAALDDQDGSAAEMVSRCRQYPIVTIGYKSRVGGEE